MDDTPSIVNPNEMSPPRKIKTKVVIVKSFSINDFLSSEDSQVEYLVDVTKLNIPNQNSHFHQKINTGDGRPLMESLWGLAPKKDLIGKGLWLRPEFKWIMVESGPNKTQMLFAVEKDKS